MLWFCVMVIVFQVDARDKDLHCGGRGVFSDMDMGLPAPLLVHRLYVFEG